MCIWILTSENQGYYNYNNSVDVLQINIKKIVTDNHYLLYSSVIGFKLIMITYRESNNYVII